MSIRPEDEANIAEQVIPMDVGELTVRQTQHALDDEQDDEHRLTLPTVGHFPSSHEATLDQRPTPDGKPMPMDIVQQVSQTSVSAEDQFEQSKHSDHPRIEMTPVRDSRI